MKGESLMTTADLLYCWKSKELLTPLDSATYIKLFLLPSNFSVACAGLYQAIYKDSPFPASSGVIQ